MTWRSTGASVNMLRTAMNAARMPAEKLSTSISKPGLIFPAHNASRCFIRYAVSGPMIMAPRNIGEPPWSPTNSGKYVATITPIVAAAPTTPPRVS